MPFVYDIKIRGLIDRETGDRLLFERVLPESATLSPTLFAEVSKYPFLQRLRGIARTRHMQSGVLNTLGKTCSDKCQSCLRRNFAKSLRTRSRALC
jgi:hypothetical protein